MFLHNGLVGLRIKRRADIADHVLRRITGIRAQNFSIRRIGKVVEKPHGIAVQQFVNVAILKVTAPFQRGCAPDYRARVVSALRPEPAKLFVDQDLHRHDICEGTANSTLFCHGRVGFPCSEVDLGMCRTRSRLRQGQRGAEHQDFWPTGQGHHRQAARAATQHLKRAQFTLF